MGRGGWGVGMVRLARGGAANQTLHCGTTKAETTTGSAPFAPLGAQRYQMRCNNTPHHPTSPAFRPLTRTQRAPTQRAWMRVKRCILRVPTLRTYGTLRGWAALGTKTRYTRSKNWFPDSDAMPMYRNRPVVMGETTEGKGGREHGSLVERERSERFPDNNKLYPKQVDHQTDPNTIT